MLTMNAYRKALSAGVVIIFFSNLPLFLFNKELFPVQPLMWVIITGLFTVPIVFQALLGTQFRIRPLAVWCSFYMLISMLWFLAFAGTGEDFGEVQQRALAISFLLLMLAVFSGDDAQRVARRAIAVCVLIAVAINLYELFHPQTFSESFRRSAGLYINPNQSGAALIVGMILSRSIVPRRYRLLFELVVGLGVLVTFSRGAMVGWLAVFILANARPKTTSFNLRTTVLIVVPIVAFLVSPWWADVQQSLQEEGLVTSSTLDRLAFFRQGAANEESAGGRAKIADLAWDSIARHPAAGLGTGTARNDPPFDTIGPHNMYLALMVDHGLLGALILPLMVLASTWGASGQIRDEAILFACFITLWGLVSHNVLEERYILLSFALMASMTATSERRVASGTATAPATRPVTSTAVTSTRQSLREVTS